MFNRLIKALFSQLYIFLFSTVITLIIFLFNMYLSDGLVIHHSNGLMQVAQDEATTNWTMVIMTYALLDGLLFTVMIIAMQLFMLNQETKSFNSPKPEDNFVSQHSLQEIQQELAISQDDYRNLSSYISHEQKNLLDILRAQIQLRKDETLLIEVDRMSEALDDVLTLSASNNMYKQQRLDLAVVCAEVVDEYHKIYKQLFFEFAEMQETIVFGRELWIKREISNLIDNAIKYGKQQPIYVTVTTEKQSVILKVIDQGVGFAEEEYTRIFNTFYRINGIKSDGYGVGLSLVKHVCKLCNGVFWSESEQDKGSIFYMVFPLVLTTTDEVIA